MNLPITYNLPFKFIGDDTRRIFFHELAVNGAKHVVLGTGLLPQMMARPELPEIVAAELEAEGLSFVDSHAPYGLHWDIGDPFEKEWNTKILRLKLSIELAAFFNVRTMTLHSGKLSSGVTPEQRFINICRALDELLDFAEKCKALLRQPATVREMAVLPEMLFISSAGNTSFDSDFLAFLNFYAGMLPVGLDESPMDQNYLLGQNAFSRNNLPEAYKFYVDSVSEKITFQACNMAGNAGRRIGRIYEATAMLLQATVARPQSVYPWVHLAWIYDIQKLNRQKQYCIEKIKT